jgi:hypothetical protein
VVPDFRLDVHVKAMTIKTDFTETNALAVIQEVIRNEG